MPRTKQQNTIRTDYLEDWIGFYLAHGQPEKANALLKVARDVGAPIDRERTDIRQNIHASHVTWSKDEQITKRTAVFP